MREKIILKIERRSQSGNAVAGLHSFESLEAAERHIRNWLETVCGLYCYCGQWEEEVLSWVSGETLPELRFACPIVHVPMDLEAYSGHYFYGFGGVVQLFITVICDAESARQFRLNATKEYALDTTLSDEADEMMDMLALLERSFTEDCDIDKALQKLDRLVSDGGLSLF